MDTVPKKKQRGRPRVVPAKLMQDLAEVFSEHSDRGRRRLYWAFRGDSAIGEGALSRFRSGLSVRVEFGLLDSLGVDAETLCIWAEDINNNPTMKVHEAAEALRRIRHSIVEGARSKALKRRKLKR